MDFNSSTKTILGFIIFQLLMISLHRSGAFGSSSILPIEVSSTDWESTPAMTPSYTMITATSTQSSTSSSHTTSSGATATSSLFSSSSSGATTTSSSSVATTTSSIQGAPTTSSSSGSSSSVATTTASSSVATTTANTLQPTPSSSYSTPYLSTIALFASESDISDSSTSDSAYSSTIEPSMSVLWNASTASIDNYGPWMGTCHPSCCNLLKSNYEMKRNCTSSSCEPDEYHHNTTRLVKCPTTCADCPGSHAGNISKSVLHQIVTCFLMTLVAYIIS